MICSLSHRQKEANISSCPHFVCNQWIIRNWTRRIREIRASQLPNILTGPVFYQRSATTCWRMCGVTGCDFGPPGIRRRWDPMKSQGIIKWTSDWWCHLSSECNFDLCQLAIFHYQVVAHAGPQATHEIRVWDIRGKNQAHYYGIIKGQCWLL